MRVKYSGKKIPHKLLHGKIYAMGFVRNDMVEVFDETGKNWLVPFGIV